MKKNILKFITLIVLLISSTSCKTISNKELNYDNFSLAIMVEQDGSKGGYAKFQDEGWPDENDYALNLTKSTCDSGSEIYWDDETKSVYLTTDDFDKCYAYFDKVIKIEHIEDLVEVAKNMKNGTTYEGKTISLIKDLDFKNREDYNNAENTQYGDLNSDGSVDKTIYEELNDTSGAGFLPIGIEGHPFKGNFDGNNHSISNIYISNKGDTKGRYFGFFGSASRSIISNLTISGTVKYDGIGDMGGIVGTLSNGTIDNCISIVTIETSSNNSYSIGGLVGSVSGTTVIKNSVNKANISPGGGNVVGGLVGCIMASKNSLTIENSYNEGDITATKSIYTGGIIGRDSAAFNSDLTINNCHNYGKIEVEYSGTLYVGGLIGLVQAKATISNSSNEAVDGENQAINIKASGSNSIYIGGIIGGVTKQVAISNSYNLSNINVTMPKIPTGYIGGVIGSILIKEGNENIINKIEQVYNTGNISGGNRVGGIVGIIGNAHTSIIDKSYNLGNLTSDENSPTAADTFVGGIVSSIRDGAEAYILNSFNEGALTSHRTDTRNAYAGGIVPITDASNEKAATLGIINCYNKGSIDAKFAIGIAGVNSKSNLTIKNVYNTGHIASEAQNKYSLVYSNTTGTLNTENMYYQEQDGVSASNKNDSIKCEVASNAQNNLAQKLNENLDKINLNNISEKIKDYKLAGWIPDIFDYPTLDVLS